MHTNTTFADAVKKTSQSFADLFAVIEGMKDGMSEDELVEWSPGDASVEQLHSYLLRHMVPTL